MSGDGASWKAVLGAFLVVLGLVASFVAAVRMSLRTGAGRAPGLARRPRRTDAGLRLLRPGEHRPRRTHAAQPGRRSA